MNANNVNLIVRHVCTTYTFTLHKTESVLKMETFIFVAIAIIISF